MCQSYFFSWLTAYKEKKYLLKGSETKFLVKVMARIVWREFPPLRKTLQDVWHCRHLVALPKHVILISHGPCTNLTSSNLNHLIRRCCTLWPNFPRQHARKNWLIWKWGSSRTVINPLTLIPSYAAVAKGQVYSLMLLLLLPSHPFLQTLYRKLFSEGKHFTSDFLGWKTRTGLRID